MYVEVVGWGLQIPALAVDGEPILPVISNFYYVGPKGVVFRISRKQAPLLPSLP